MHGLGVGLPGLSGLGRIQFQPFLLLPAWGAGAVIAAAASSGFQCHSEHASTRVKNSSCLWKLFEDRECRDWNYSYLWVFFLKMHSISVSDG